MPWCHGTEVMTNRDRHVYPWILFVVGFVVLATYANTTLPVLATGIDEHFGIRRSQVGLLLSASLFGQLLPLLFAGPILDTMGPRRVLATSYAGIVLSFFGASISPTYILFFSSLVGIGLFISIISLAVPLYIISLVPSWKRKSFSLRMISGLLSGLFFPLLVERLMVRHPDNFGVVFHLPFGVIAAITMTMFLLFAFRAPRGSEYTASYRGSAGRRTIVTNSLAGYRRFLKRGRFWLYAVLLGLHGGADSTLMKWFPTYLSDTFDFLPLGPGVVLTMYSAGYFLSRMMLILLPDESGRRLFLVYPGLIGGSILLAGILVENAYVSAIAYPLAGFFWSFEAPALFAEAFREFRENFGTFQALLSLSPAAIAIVATNLTGLVVEAGTSLTAVMSVSAASFLAFGFIAAVSGIGKS